ncbi:DUF3943 domain-containing protein [Hyalangium gracile]|uniref:DUF3943 domain-containing protein n=1 Tax=Hyalangium gracile TaxID=394092 RepID=UPI001CCA2F6F|nr:DUF3943 domain-containing protein [Hyalangium gracile]
MNSHCLSIVAPCMALLLAGPETASAEERPLPADAPRVLDEKPDAVREPLLPAEPPVRREPWIALGELTAFNVGVWAVDRYLLDREWARISPDSMKSNLVSGFIWDTDEFGTNQFAHPYHGGLYYNAARDNGFGYVGASLFTLLGSLQWELLAETQRPSFNDLINTSLGGIAVGEVLYQLSGLALDERATGLERFRRELSAATLSPARGLNRLVRGAAWRTRSNPPATSSPRPIVLGQFGYLKLADTQALTEGTNQLFAQLHLRSGDAVHGELRRPFDAFSVVAQFVTGERRLVSHARIQGLLASTSLLRTEDARLVLGAMQHFDYTHVHAYEVGGQSLGGSLLYARVLSPATTLRAGLHMKGLVLGGISSEYAQEQGRTYDYGPGVDLQFEAQYLHEDWEIATASLGTAWIHTLNGSSGNHLFHAGSVQVDLPVYRSLGMGMGVVLFRRDSLFHDYPDTTQHISQIRVFLSVH